MPTSLPGLVSASRGAAQACSHGRQARGHESPTVSARRSRFVVTNKPAVCRDRNPAGLSLCMPPFRRLPQTTGSAGGMLIRSRAPALHTAVLVDDEQPAVG